MNPYKFRTVRLLFPALLLLAALGAGTGAAALDAALQEHFTAMASYGQGMSEVPLRTIEEAVRAANADPAVSPSSSELEQALIALLEGDSTTDAKRFACRMLGEIGNPAGAAALAAQLAVPELFSTALAALEHMGTPEAAQVIMGTLESADAEKRVPLLTALGRQGRPESAAAVLPFLKDPDPGIGYTAAQALADIESMESCRALFDAFNDPAFADKQPLLDGCLSCAETFLDSDAKDTVFASLETMTGSSFPVHVRLASARLLMKAQPERAQNLLAAFLRDEDPALSSDALILARALNTPPVTEALVSLLDTVEGKRRIALIEALGARGDASALPAVRALADDESPELRQAALKATGLLGNASLAEFLLDRAVNGSSEEQRIAREGLATMPDPELNARLTAIAEGATEEPLRLRAIALLAERRAVESVQQLFALAAQASPVIRAEAVSALRTLAPGERLKDMLQFAVLPGVGDVAAVLPQALADIAQRQPVLGADPALPVVELLRQVADGTTGGELSPEQRSASRCLLLETLALVGSDTAFAEMRANLTDENAEVRKSAVSGLSRFQRTDALNELKARVSEEQDAAIRVLAYSAYLASLRNAQALPRKEVDAHLTYAAEQAQTTASRREFLAAATQLPSLACLRLIEQQLESADVAAEALRAALTVSKALAGAWPEAARTRLEAIAAAPDQTPETIHEAKEALNFMRKHKDYLLAWEMAGPYFETQTTATVLFDHSFPPETDLENANWRVLPVLMDADPAFKLEFDRVLGGEERVVFVRTFITVPAETDAVLELGTNDGCKIWWNGNPVHALNVGRPLTPGEDKLPVRLASGVNTLMMAVFQQGGAWCATARLTDPQGQPLQNVTVSSQLPETE